MLRVKQYWLFRMHYALTQSHALSHITFIIILWSESFHYSNFRWRKWDPERWTCLSIHNGTPLQYSCLENPMDGGAWWAAVHGVTGGRTQLSNFTFTFHFHALEREMATHSSVLAWRIPGTEEPGGLPSMGLHRVRHDWSDLAAAAAAAALSINLGWVFQYKFIWKSDPKT